MLEAPTRRRRRSKRPPPSRAELQKQLRPRSTTPERVTALMTLISAAQVATATGASESSVRNWSAAKGEPRPTTAMALDDLRAVTETLLRSGMEPKQAAGWLTSRGLDGQRPIDEISDRPTKVLAQAVDETFEELVAAREAE